jgi:hypothetical protein
LTFIKVTVYTGVREKEETVNTDKINDLLRDWTNCSVTIEVDEWPIEGVVSWADVNVSAESDMVLSVVKLPNGDVVAGESYGSHNFSRFTKTVNEIFTLDKFLYFIGESPNYVENCPEMECDNWGDPGCVEHTTYNGGVKAWNVIDTEILPMFR